MIWVISYIIPIMLGCVCVWIDMKKGESVSEYFDAEKGVFADAFTILIIMFIPAVNLLTLFITIPFLVFNLVKDIRK